MKRPLAGALINVVVVVLLAFGLSESSGRLVEPIGNAEKQPQITSELNLNSMQLKQVPSDKLCKIVDERRRSKNAPHVNYL